ncbi:hypothetical protein HJG60_008040 [Phyllostomus discolor]|uniref:Uncharacterized protein n=1 Tax=Phyllostomus discolor TaxID=89673 RepID=A0A834ERW4_9CHIR|nr:hypothetical protein HJG60_008040 [Phyllostomus discolor]
MVFSAKIQGMQLSRRQGSNSPEWTCACAEGAHYQKTPCALQTIFLVEQATDFKPFKVPVCGARRPQSSRRYPAVCLLGILHACVYGLEVAVFFSFPPSTCGVYLFNSTRRHLAACDWHLSLTLTGLLEQGIWKQGGSLVPSVCVCVCHTAISPGSFRVQARKGVERYTKLSIHIGSSARKGGGEERQVPPPPGPRAHTRPPQLRLAERGLV